jgi:hypothetical protein
MFVSAALKDFRKLFIHVIKMVTGIKNSTNGEGSLKISNTLNASVAECPMVNAVINTNIFFILSLHKLHIRLKETACDHIRLNQ